MTFRERQLQLVPSLLLGHIVIPLHAWNGCRPVSLSIRLCNRMGLFLRKCNAFEITRSIFLFFYQSVAKHFGFLLSTIRTPSSIYFRITAFDSWERVSSFSSHANGVPGFVWIESNAITSTNIQPFAGLEETVLNVVGPYELIIYTFRFAWEIKDYVIKSPSISIPRGNVILRRSFIYMYVPFPRCNKCR